jgi:hypothetical protein
MAADGGTNDGPVGDAIAAAAFEAAGVPCNAAIARGRGGGAIRSSARSARPDHLKVGGEVGITTTTSTWASVLSDAHDPTLTR